MKVLFVSSEAVPFSKTGGLADVSGALPKALKRAGCDVRLVVPYYKMTHDAGFSTKKLFDLEIDVGRSTPCTILETYLEKDITVYLVRSDYYFLRDYLYSTPLGDYKDNCERFSLFCKAIMEIIRKTDFKPSVIHANDWQTGLVPAYLKLVDRDIEACSVFTIHNLAYQGIFRKEELYKTGLPPEVYTIEGIEFYGNISLLKAGVVYSDVVNTVSKKYSLEIQTPEYGYGFEGILAEKAREGRLFGILNGADYEEWNPEKDRFIKENYSANNIGGKRICKADLLETFDLPKRMDVPVVGMVSRLAAQKGFDLLAEAISELLAMDLFLVILGTGEKRYHDLLLNMKAEYKEKLGLKPAYDNTLAHKIEAGSDMFLMPSRYEPCGLNQIYSLKYGTIPIVRATGGLDDTIIDADEYPKEGVGFKFYAYSREAMLSAVRRAINAYKNKRRWREIRKRAMAKDFSWDNSAKSYIELYEKAKALKRNL